MGTSGRAIAYPRARLVPGRFEDAPPDIESHDNARAQWKPYRGWFGTFVENVVAGVARDLLAAAIERFEERGAAVVFHCHDELTVETPIGSISDQEFLDILLEAPVWAHGLPLSGKVHTGAHYLPPPERPAEPLPQQPDPLEQAIEAYVDTARQDLGPIDDPAIVERQDDEDFVAGLPDDFAPLTELITSPLTADDKVCCPFHEEIEPSCTIYADHFHCFGCGEHGARVDWLVRVEGMTAAEAIGTIKDWSGSRKPTLRDEDAADKLAFVQTIWAAAGTIRGSIAERYLDETRGVDLTNLPHDIHGALRFHPACVFGSGTRLPCLIALMRDPVTDAPVGIQRIALEERGGRINKIERRMLGQAGVVKLWPAGSTLVVGEGLETVLAAATRIPFEGAPLTPAWAALTKGGLAQLPAIDGVERLIVLVDNDSNGEGQRGATAAAMRWRAAGRVVVTLMPDTPDSDFNDVVLKEDAHV